MATIVIIFISIIHQVVFAPIATDANHSLPGRDCPGSAGIGFRDVVPWSSVPDFLSAHHVRAQWRSTLA